jgi:hypothetical protein
MAQLQREEEEREFERNSRVTMNDQVVTGYGGVATFVDSDGTVYEDDPSPSPDRLEHDRVRAHALRSRVRNQRYGGPPRAPVSGRGGGCPRHVERDQRLGGALSVAVMDPAATTLTDLARTTTHPNGR